MSADIRIGNRFLVEVEVVSAVSDGFHHLRRLTVPYNTKGPWHVDLPEDCLRNAKRLPRAIKVGDRVRDRDGDDGKVLAVDGDHAWVLMGGEYHITMSIPALTLIDEAAP